MKNSEAHNRWVQQNPERVAAYKKRYAVANSAKVRASRKAWAERNRAANLARYLVQQYVRIGRLKKPNACSICKKLCVTHGHHIDYSEQLLVVWVCPSCHKKVHAQKLDVRNLAVPYQYQAKRRKR